MKRWHTLSITEIFESLQTGENGLTSDEAQIRLQKYGKNALVEDKKKTLFQRFLEQFKDVMVIVLLVAAIISGALGELADSLIILSIVIINAIIGVVQENKAEKALDALKSMSKPFARVYRDGDVKTIKREEIVPGDLVELEAGEYIPADIRLIQSASLKVQESALTGESVAVEKNIDKIDDEDIPLGDRSNMVYTSGIITYGRGSGIVVSAGMDTEVGKIAEYISESDFDMDTPLKKRLNATGKVLSIAVLGVAVLIFITGMIQGRNPLDMFMTAVSLAVAAIPEGLPAIVTVVLALGVQRMSERKAIIRKLPAVETLGSTQIICSDKTGTLTLNEMTVKKTYIPEGDKDTLSMDLLLKIMVLCNDTKTSGDKDNRKTIGDPTETALISFAEEKGLFKKELEQQYMREQEAPFDSERKLMTTVNNFDGNSKALVKGAYDVLIEKCTHIFKDGKIIKILDKDREAIETASSTMADNALRVLAYAFKNVEKIDKDISVEELERDLVFVGLTGMIDPPREEVKQAIVVCRKAGMRPVMITGDHGNTAYAIASQLGIAKEKNEVITGRDLDLLSDEQLKEKIVDLSVFARVSPEHKVRIVKAWQSRGKVVAMTGDGVNDAPSLKAADIGIGMGITGTDVAKNVADMVLADDNFATIIVAVEEGRKTYDNIRKAIQFLLSANIAEVLSVFIATLLNWHFIYPIHILWINLVTDSLPALSLGMEPVEPGIMEKPPRNPDKNLFSGIIGINIIYQGILQAIITLLTYLYALKNYGTDTAITMAFMVLGIIQLFHVLNSRSTVNTLFHKNFFSNKYLFGALAISAIMQVSVVAIPGLNKIFRTVPLTGKQWLITIGAAVLIIPLVEIVKFILRRTKLAQE